MTNLTLSERLAAVFESLGSQKLDSQIEADIRLFDLGPLWSFLDRKDPKVEVSYQFEKKQYLTSIFPRMGNPLLEILRESREDRDVFFGVFDAFASLYEAAKQYDAASPILELLARSSKLLRELKPEEEQSFISVIMYIEKLKDLQWVDRDQLTTFQTQIGLVKADSWESTKILPILIQIQAIEGQIDALYADIKLMGEPAFRELTRFEDGHNERRWNLIKLTEAWQKSLLALYAPLREIEDALGHDDVYQRTVIERLRIDIRRNERNARIVPLG